MGTEVQSKMYLPRPGHYAIRDVDENAVNRSWNLHQETRASMYGQYYDKFRTGPSKEEYSGSDKQQMKQTILNQELVFKHQIHELHRLYRRQRHLMKDFQCQNKNSIIVKDGESRCKKLQKRLFDLEVPADQYIDIEDEQVDQIKIGLSKKETDPFSIDHDITHSLDLNVSSDYNFRTSSSHGHFWNHGLANLNEPIKPHEPYQLPPFDRSKVELQKRKTIFGVDISERQFVLPPNTFRSHTPEIQLFGSSLKFSSEKPAKNSSQNLGLSLNKCPMQHDGGLPWLKKSIYSVETSKEKEGSQLFSNKTEIQESSSATFSNGIGMILQVPIFDTPPKSKLSHLSCIDDDKTKRVGSPAIELALDSALLISKEQIESENQVTDKNLNNDFISGTRHHFDLNMCLNEDEAVQSLQDDLGTCHEENIKFAAEAIVDLSSYCTPYSQPPPNNSLHWFADMISSYTSILGKNDDIAPSEKAIAKIDYFEFMTLKLTETKTEECYYKPEVLENQRNEEYLPKRPRRGQQARRRRQKRDFQKDILPDIASLSRHEVTEDMQMIESMIRTTGGTWESSLSKRNAARGKRRSRSSTIAPCTASRKCVPDRSSACKRFKFYGMGKTDKASTEAEIPGCYSSCFGKIKWCCRS